MKSPWRRPRQRIRAKLVQVWLEEEEHLRLKAAALQLRMSVSEFVRRVIAARLPRVEE